MGSILNKLNEIKESLQSTGQDIHDVAVFLGKLTYLITHPGQLAWMIWGGLVYYSFYITIIIFVVGVVLYLIGYQKGSKWARLSIFGYVAIKLFNHLMTGGI